MTPPAPRSGADIAISIIALVCTFLGGAAAAFLGLMTLAFTDYCPPETCHIDRGVTLITTGFGIAAAIAVIGTVITTIRLVRRSLAWPFAVGTLILCGMACVSGIFGYITAVSG